MFNSEEGKASNVEQNVRRGVTSEQRLEVREQVMLSDFTFFPMQG